MSRIEAHEQNQQSWALLAPVWVLSLLLGASGATAQALSHSGHGAHTQAFRGFVENHGQWSTNALFVAEFGDLLIRAEPGAIALQTRVASTERALVGVVRLRFQGGEDRQPVGIDRSAGEMHYLSGSDPLNWRRHVPTWKEISYEGVRAGVDVRLCRGQGGFVYEVQLAPEADLQDLVLRCEGMAALSIRSDGALIMDTPLGPLVQTTPTARSILANGQVQPANCAFRLIDSQHFGFTVGDRPSNSTLLIEPGLTWATFLGGSDGDWAECVQILESGRILVVGRSESTDFPATAGAFDSELGGPTAADATVTCLESTGDALVFATYLGGQLNDQGLACGVSLDGSVVVGGTTSSPDFPTTQGAFDRTLAGNADAFVSVLSSDGSSLNYSTFIGGSTSCLERVNAVTVSSSGLIVIGGSTCNGADSFPVTAEAFDPTANGSADAFIAWLDVAAGTSEQVVCCSFLGGAGSDNITAMALGPGDEPIVVGDSVSVNFPTTPGVYDDTAGGQFITRFTANGTGLVASTRFKSLWSGDVAYDGGTIVISGTANSLLPTTPGVFDTGWNGNTDGFVARIDGQLGQLIASTYVGGTDDDATYRLAVDGAGDIVLAGSTNSEDFPVTPGAFDTEHAGPGTSVVARLAPDLSELLYGTFLGGNSALSSLASDVAAVGVADVVVVGDNATSSFPVTPGAFDETFNGGTLAGGDVYVARMLLKPETWAVVGNGLAGSNGLPALSGAGELVGGQPVTLTLIRAKPSTAVTLIIGLDMLNAPFKGGTLIPDPHVLLFGLPTTPQGTLSLSATWPIGLPSGFAFVSQFWIPDPAGPAGFAASNGLIGTTP